MADKELIQVANLSQLNALQNHNEGEVAYLTDETKYMIYKEGRWEEFTPKVKNDGVNMSLYDYNKQIIKQLTPLTDEQLDELKIKINQWANKRFYLLYCKELSYFTLFQKYHKENGFTSLGEAVVTILKELNRKIYSADFTKDRTGVEIWIETPAGNDTAVYYLFNYDNGVVNYG